MKLVRRWLTLHGASAIAIEELSARATARATRYDPPLGRLWRLLVWALDWLAPLLVLGRFRRAATLDDAGLLALENRLHHHRLLAVRGAAHLFRLPLWDVLYQEPPPPATASAPPPHPLQSRLERQPTTLPLEYDVIIIGSGAGGAPVAWQLAGAGLRVAVVEAGGLVTAMPPMRALERLYLRQGMTAAVSGGMLAVFAGQAAGGTTAINSGTCLRPPAEWLAPWDAALGTDFATSLGPRLDIVADRLQVTVPPRSLLGASAHLFERGLNALGRHGAYVLPRNAPTCRGDGVCCFGCPTGAKRSVDRAFLPDAIDAGATLWLDARATGLTEEAGGAVVSLATRDGPVTLRARHVVLSAGALQTPALIRRWQLGANWRLAGDHLKIHPATKVFAQFQDPVHGDSGVPQGLGYQPPELQRVVMEGIFTPRSAVPPILAVAGRDADTWLGDMDHTATFGLMLRERGHGSIQWRAGWPLLRYQLGREDALDIGRGILLIGETFFAAGARKLLLPAVAMANQPKTLADLRKLSPEDFSPTRLIASGFHPQGTAGMGRVVDTQLRLTPHVSVCDASVLPDTPGVNPQMTLMALSLRLAERLVGELA